MNRNEASRLVELMGADWYERPAPPDHHNTDKRTELFRKDGLSLSLSFGGGWRMEHRLVIHASFESKRGLSRSLRDYALYSEREKVTTEITLALDKPVERVAAEIKRRLLTSVDPLILKGIAADERARQAEEYREAWQARFIRTSGDRLELAYHEKNALRSKEGRDVEIKEHYSDNTFRVELAALTAEQVDNILRMVFPA